MVLIFTQGNPDQSLFQVYFNYTQKMFQLLNFEVRTPIVITGMRSETAQERKNLDSSLQEVGSSLLLK
jgi:hypothetical protein